MSIKRFLSCILAFYAQDIDEIAQSISWQRTLYTYGYVCSKLMLISVHLLRMHIKKRKKNFE